MRLSAHNNAIATQGSWQTRAPIRQPTSTATDPQTAVRRAAGPGVAGQGLAAPRPLRTKVVAWLWSWPLNDAAVNAAAV